MSLCPLCHIEPPCRHFKRQQKAFLRESKGMSVFIGKCHQARLDGFAKRMIDNPTVAEAQFRELLSLSFPFLDVTFQCVIGQFIADFYCREHDAIIEIDGSIHNTAKAKKKDFARQRFFERRGLQVIRFTNDQVLTDPLFCIRSIASRFNLHPITDHLSPRSSHLYRTTGPSRAIPRKREDGSGHGKSRTCALPVSIG